MLGLVAFGQIPQLMAPKAKAFGMRVVTYDPYIPDEVLKRAGVERVEFDELVRMSDYISIHTPLMPATHHLFNADIFSRMKPGAYIVNTARGPIIDEAALAVALDKKQIAGAALDVMEKEPPGSSPLSDATTSSSRRTPAFIPKSRWSICRPKRPKKWSACSPAGAEEPCQSRSASSQAKRTKVGRGLTILNYGTALLTTRRTYTLQRPMHRKE